jgi:CubicO group peptidase (beta-lactamase class C family)
MPVTVDTERLQEALDATVAEKSTALEVPGVAVGVYVEGHELYAFHGVTSVENPLPVDGQTLFQIGSITKTYTATAIMRLVEAGRLELAAPVREYVPELRLKDQAAASSVTLRQLLNHTAGWAGDVFMDTGQGDDALARFVERMGELDQQSSLGSRASYNNAAFSLAGRVVEKATGKVFEAALQELVLEPLGLQNSFQFMADVMTRRFAVGHYNRDSGLEVARRWNIPRSSAAAGGIATTPADQLRYARFHMGDGMADGKRILSRESLDLMKRPTYSLEGTSLGDEVGIAWLMRDVAGVRAIGHGGGTNGQMSSLQMIPERDFAIAIMTNSTNGSQLLIELLSWVLAAFLGVVEAEPTALNLTSEALAEYAGTYETETSRVRIELESGKLIAHVSPSERGREAMRAFSGEQERPLPPPLPLTIVPGDRFRITEGFGKGSRGAFVREGGEIVGVNFGGRLALRTDS